MSNWYVKPGGGTGAGTSWTTAWSIAGFSSHMGSIAPGDTVWFAGGNYGTVSFTISASGTSGNPITYKRVVASDPIAGSVASDWNSSFDSTIVMNTGSGAACMTLQASWIVVDGRTGLLGTSGGWVINYVDNSSAIGDTSTATNNVTLRYLTTWGPGIITQTSDTRGFDISNTGNKTFYLMQYCEAGHGGDTNMQIGVNSGTLTDFTMEYCWCHDAGAINAGSFHPNLLIFGPSNRVTIRYNRFYNIDVEGLFPAYDCANWYVYGNLFYQGSIPLNTGRAFEFDSGAAVSNIFFYNNTIVDLPLGTRFDQGASTSGCVSRNNLYWNTGNSGYQTGWTHDHNFYSGATEGGSGDIGSGTQPFASYVANSTTSDYHIISTVGAKFPRDKGASIAPVSGQTINLDPDGNIRGADGTWDIGAYEYSTGGGGGGGSTGFWPIRQI